MWMNFDAPAMASFYRDDATMEDPTLDEPRVGRTAIERYYDSMFRDLENPDHKLLDWAARGERIWFEWTFESGGNHSPRVAYHGVSIQSFRDELIVHDYAFWDPGGWWKPWLVSHGLG
jgi:hypothetical protein